MGTQKIARIASARLNNLLRGLPNYSCNMPSKHFIPLKRIIRAGEKGVLN